MLFILNGTLVLVFLIGMRTQNQIWLVISKLTEALTLFTDKERLNLEQLGSVFSVGNTFKMLSHSN